MTWPSAIADGDTKQGAKGTQNRQAIIDIGCASTWKAGRLGRIQRRWSCEAMILVEKISSFITCQRISAAGGAGVSSQVWEQAAEEDI